MLTHKVSFGQGMLHFKIRPGLSLVECQCSVHSLGEEIVIQII